jgi:uncharacterized membrane protein YraQ (UPF0718 family)
MAHNFSAAQPTASPKHPDWQSWLVVVLAALIWWLLYSLLLPAANWLTYTALGLAPDSPLGESVAFFLYDVHKILLLLTGMIFVVSTARSFFSVERTRQLLGGRREGMGNVLAALLGIITPFCSCSAVPLFIGFLEGGIPLGVTFSFLIAAPMVNEVALIMLIGLVGWQIAGLYALTGVIIAILAGFAIGRIPNVERGVEDFVWQVHMGNVAYFGPSPTWTERFQGAWQNTRSIVSKVWPFVVVGIAVGAAIHGYVPADALAGVLGKESWWSVPLGVLVGIPLYANAAGIIPVVQAVMSKGAALGTTLAFMMSVVALSLPEIIILRRVLKPRLIIVFVGIVATGIIFTGYFFNAIM